MTDPHPPRPDFELEVNWGEVELQWFGTTIVTLRNGGERGTLYRWYVDYNAENMDGDDTWNYPFQVSNNGKIREIAEPSAYAG